MNRHIQFFILCIIFFGIVNQYAVVNSEEIVYNFRIDMNETLTDNFTVEIGTTHRFFVYCYDAGHHWLHNMWDLKSSFFPPRAGVRSTNFTHFNQSYNDYDVDRIPGWAYNWRDITFTVPGVMIWNATGMCNLGYKTYFAYINVTIPVIIHDTLKFTKPAGVPAYYNQNDFSKAYFSWTNPTTGEKLSATNEITNPTNNIIEIGYIVTFGEFGRLTQIFRPNDMDMYVIGGDLPEYSLVPTSSPQPITPITVFSPGERKFTDKYTYDLIFNITNCAKSFPGQTINFLGSGGAPQIHLMMKQHVNATYPWTTSYWVPIAEALLHYGYSAPYNKTTQNYDLRDCDDCFWSEPVPYINVSGATRWDIPEWHGFIQDRVAWKKTAEAPYCYEYVGPQ